MRKPPIPSLLLQAIKQAPSAGLELMFAMVEEGQVAFSDHVPVNGAPLPLIDAVFNLAMHEGSAPMRVGSTLFQEVFSPKHVQRWLDLTDGQAFDRRDKNDRWIPAAFLELLTSATIKLSGGPRKNPPKLPEKQSLDRWLSTVAPTLPREAWEKEGAFLLVKAFDSDMPRSIAAIWPHVDMLEMVGDEPVICHARRAQAWERFVSEGGDVNAPIAGKPLWRHILSKVAAEKPAHPQAFLNGFECWFLKNAPSNPAMRPALDDLVMSRTRRPARTSVEHWMAMLDAAGPSSLTRTCVGTEDVKVWEAVALSQAGESFFSNLLAYPRLLSALDPDELAHVRLLTMVRDLSSEREVKAKDALSRIERTVQLSGWPKKGSPWVRSFCRLPLNASVRTKLLQLAAIDEHAWIGAPESQHDIGRSLFFMVPNLLNKGASAPARQGFQNGRSKPPGSKDRLLTWQALTYPANDNPWIQVGRGLASALCNKLDDLHGVSRDAIGVVARDPHGLATLEIMSKSIASKHHKNYLSWLDGVRLEAAAPAAQQRRASPRL